MLRQGDAAAGQQGDRVPHLVLHQFEVGAADHILEMDLAGVSQPPGLFGGRQTDHPRPGRHQGRYPVRGLEVAGHHDPDEELGITLLDGLHEADDLGVVRELYGPDLGQKRVIQVHRADGELRHQKVSCVHQVGADRVASDKRHGAQCLGRGGENLPQARRVGPQGRFRQDHGQGELHQGRRLEQQMARLVKHQEHGLAAQVDGGADVFPAVNAVPGGPDDLRHVGPQGVEALAGEDAAVTSAGNRDLAGFRLVPGGADDLRDVVVVAQLAVLGVHGLKDQFPGAALDAAITAPAHLIDGVHELLAVEIPLFVGVHRADLFDAALAPEAAFIPVDDGGFGQGRQPRRHPANRYMVFGWQNFLRIKILGGKRVKGKKGKATAEHSLLFFSGCCLSLF